MTEEKADTKHLAEQTSQRGVEDTKLLMKGSKQRMTKYKQQNKEIKTGRDISNRIICTNTLFSITRDIHSIQNDNIRQSLKPEDTPQRKEYIHEKAKGRHEITEGRQETAGGRHKIAEGRHETVEGRH